ncbi:MAG: hypothetical protein M3Z75_03355 [Actinomycetota bacterium]|nr:hypothetical protein [Actinomycetota bacterium]
MPSGPQARTAQAAGPRTPLPDAYGRAASGAELAVRSVSATLRGFVEIAGIQDLQLNPHERERIQQRIRAIRTLGDARDYIAEVAAQLPATRPGRTAGPPDRS